MSRSDVLLREVVLDATAKSASGVFLVVFHEQKSLGSIPAAFEKTVKDKSVYALSALGDLIERNFPAANEAIVHLPLGAILLKKNGRYWELAPKTFLEPVEPDEALLI